ncbi:GNAT family N-acetyltransferase [Glycomyces terrestris]|uniref:GNAT family N-acetyltransferase n=1 Tax=Glycomyces terrestris TaxID=2493553 RepID=A0A426V0N7_9ACTN|nr:GNAT family N-acetyltransferase [Glycomyces terrestris]RRS00385.1 GNAT family N-acetyltransferase [Glycomyces terrestris]
MTTTTSRTSTAWTIEHCPWDHAEGRELRERQREEISARFGDDDLEPGPQPSAEDVSVFLVLRGPGGEPVGCGALREIDAASVEVKRMYVVPESRGSGAAAALLAGLEAAARERGWAVMRLETGDEARMPEANRFYAREGYRRIPPFGHYVGSEVSICYEKRLA